MRAALFSLLLSLPLLSAEILFINDYETGLSKAKEVKKPVMLMVVTQYCLWCRKMKTATLTDDRIVERIKREFVPVMIYRDQQKGTYPDAFSARLVPTFYFLDENGEEFYSSYGYKPAGAFNRELSEAVESYKNPIVLE